MGKYMKTLTTTALKNMLVGKRVRIVHANGQSTEQLVLAERLDQYIVTGQIRMAAWRVEQQRK